MTNKYTLIDEDRPDKLLRIKALIDVRPYVPKGTLGGLVQSEANLSQKGNYDPDPATICGPGLHASPATFWKDNAPSTTALVAVEIDVADITCIGGS